MAISKTLISEFAKATNDTPTTKSESTVYGTIRVSGNKKEVKLDGSDSYIPVSSTTSTTTALADGDRVTVLIKDHKAVVTGNLTNPSTNVAQVNGIFTNMFATTAYIDKLIANKADIEDLTATNAEITKLKAADVTINGQLTAQLARIETLESERITTNYLVANYATITNLNAAVGRISTLEANSANVGDLTSGLAKIQTLMFGSASGNTIQTSFSNSVIAQLGSAQIKSAMIDSISASKITAGDIITNNVRVKSNDDSLVIADGTIQISDGANVRVQIGKDADDDYSINIWDQNGTLMFSKGGIEEAGIKKAIIRNDMVSDTANISASKLDIDSLFEEINGSSKTIKATKVELDETNQTLEVAFKTLSDNVSSQGTSISVIQGKIESKIWQQDINTAKGEMSTQYSALTQDLNGFKTSVGETYATKTTVDNIDAEIPNLDSRIGSAEASITQLSNKITANVSETTNLGTRTTTLEQTSTSLTTRITNAEKNVTNAGKTATNFLNFSSGGLVIGDLTGSALGKNVLIDSDSVDIRNGNNTLASFGEDYLYLAKHNTNAKIDLCNSKALLYHEVDSKGYSVFNIDTTYGLSYIKMSAPMHDLLVLENTNSTNGVIIKGMINGKTVGGFGLVRDGHMVRYGADADEDNPVEHVVLDTGNYLDETDGGWQYTGGYGEDFVQYNNDEVTMPKYRKIGRIVEMRGVVRPTKVIAGSTTHYEIFTLKEGYRPSGYIYQNCRGNYTNSWLLTIAPSGRVSFSRYGNGSTYLEVDTSTWLPFQLTFFTD